MTIPRSTLRMGASLAVVLALLAGCGDPPIRKTNCWSGMAFLATSDCR